MATSATLTVSQQAQYSGLAAVNLSEETSAVVGETSHGSYMQLNRALRASGRGAAHCTQFNDPRLRSANLVFVLVSSFKEIDLIPQVAELLTRSQHISVVPVVEYDDQERAATLLELGCIDYLLAPFSEVQLEQLLRRQANAQMSREDFVTGTHSGRRLLAMAQRVAMAQAPILISGETGTGKEMMARYIHRFAAKEDKPFVAVNCAAIPEQMLESILFGHERGAFTGATQSQPGKFELANGGTLMLDEIGELPMNLQAKLLRVLQDGKVERLGGQREIPLQVRIIAATNRDLHAEVAAGRFRSDLLFRLDVLPLQISPLRERKDDLLSLTRHLIQKHSPHEQAEQLLTDATCSALLAHDWPGNVRELENRIQRALVMRKGLFIQPEDLGLCAPESTDQDCTAISGKTELRSKGKLAEYQHVLDTLRRCGGNKTEAAKELGMTTRGLRYRLSSMRKQGVDVDE